MSQVAPRSVSRGHLTSVFSGQVTSAFTRGEDAVMQEQVHRGPGNEGCQLLGLDRSRARTRTQ
jgi:hypothetical protein